MKRSALLFLVSLSLFSCSTAYRSDSWPASLPPQAYFVDYYIQDKANQEVLDLGEYLTWVKRFYLGWELYNQGWLKVADKLPQTLKSEEDKINSRNKVLNIGKLVAPEWAKDPRHRVINTRHLGIWGNAINESIVRSEQIQLLEKILTDVNDLLNKKIKPSDITSDRYYPVELFGGDF